ncbi:MAG: CcmE/CycJ protein [Rickettsiaceae bacterium]|jgi:cytochrome c-type biogenesis protein CcmE|nr:CcmE/CycJ protein [Rickettsiaceae bacterium]
MKPPLKKSNPKKQQRIKFIVVLSFISLVALGFIILNFRNNIVFFYSPSELANLKVSEQKIIRVGGLVEKGSVKSLGNNLEFVITDFKAKLKISYDGIKPDLFREEQGIVAKGRFDEKNMVFVASEILAKHDENYMPPEVAKAIKDNAEYKNNHPQN